MIGDSTMRQMFQSLACLLREHVQDGFLTVGMYLCACAFSTRMPLGSFCGAFSHESYWQGDPVSLQQHETSGCSCAGLMAAKPLYHGLQGQDLHPVAALDRSTMAGALPVDSLMTKT